MMRVLHLASASFITDFVLGGRERHALKGEACCCARWRSTFCILQKCVVTFKWMSTKNAAWEFNDFQVAQQAQCPSNVFSYIQVNGNSER
jgi:hypothetical protein